MPAGRAGPFAIRFKADPDIGCGALGMSGDRGRPVSLVLNRRAKYLLAVVGVSLTVGVVAVALRYALAWPSGGAVTAQQSAEIGWLLLIWFWAGLVAFSFFVLFLVAAWSDRRDPGEAHAAASASAATHLR